MAKEKQYLEDFYKKCVYDNETPAVKECSKCGAGLCDFCGYIKDGKSLCNTCYCEEMNIPY